MPSQRIASRFLSRVISKPMVLINIFGFFFSVLLQLTGNLLFFDRGAWQPTTLNMMVRDFCAVMYDKKQLWYTDWSSHVMNREEIKDNCIKVPGVGSISSPYYYGYCVILFCFSDTIPYRIL